MWCGSCGGGGMCVCDREKIRKGKFGKICCVWFFECVCGGKIVKGRKGGGEMCWRGGGGGGGGTWFDGDGGE